MKRKEYIGTQKVKQVTDFYGKRLFIKTKA